MIVATYRRVVTGKKLSIQDASRKMENLNQIQAVKRNRCNGNTFGALFRKETFKLNWRQEVNMGIVMEKIYQYNLSTSFQSCR